MNVIIPRTGTLSALGHHIEREGDSVVKDHVSPDLIIQPPTFLPECVLKNLDLEVFPSLSPSHWLTRWFGGQQFVDQTLCGQTLVGLMDGNLGPEVPTACCGTYVRAVHEQLERYFDENGLGLVLGEMNYRGPVTLVCHDRSVVSVVLGIPDYGLYAQLEGRAGSIVKHFQSPRPFMESWVGALLITRSPFPYSLQADPEPLEGISASTEKHLYLFGHSQFRTSYMSQESRVGVAVAWSRKGWADCSERLLYTADQISIDEKQYRLDILRAFSPTWERLRAEKTISFE